MRPSSPTTASLLLLVAAASGACCLALVLAVGACTASSTGVGVAAHGWRPPRSPPSSPVVLLGVDYSLVAARANGDPAGGGGGRDLLGGAVEQDYGYVDPTPDTRRRGGTAPIPHNLDGDRVGDDDGP
ncbi:unnamed protein product [Urochloa humidicola]